MEEGSRSTDEQAVSYAAMIPTSGKEVTATALDGGSVLKLVENIRERTHSSYVCSQ